MSAFYLRLPDMMMGVDEAGRDELSCAINDFGRLGWWVNLGGDTSDLVTLDQERMVFEGNDVIVPWSTRDQQSGVLQQNRRHFLEV